MTGHVRWRCRSTETHRGNSDKHNPTHRQAYTHTSEQKDGQKTHRNAHTRNYWCWHSVGESQGYGGTAVMFGACVSTGGFTKCGLTSLQSLLIIMPGRGSPPAGKHKNICLSAWLNSRAEASVLFKRSLRLLSHGPSRRHILQPPRKRLSCARTPRFARRSPGPPSSSFTLHHPVKVPRPDVRSLRHAEKVLISRAPGRDAVHASTPEHQIIILTQPASQVVSDAATKTPMETKSLSEALAPLPTM